MTKIGSPGGPIKPSIPDVESQQISPNIKEALPDKIMPQTANPGGATDAKAVMNSQAELMKIKLQENLKAAGDAGTAIPEKWSPPHGSSAPIHPDINLPGSSTLSKSPSAEHPSAPPLHPTPKPPRSVPHPDIPLETSAAPPSKLVNDKPATQLAEEKKK